MDKPYRANVGIFLLNKDKKVFVAQRLDTPGPAWQMPQGGIDEGEDPFEAALRELKEEIGTDNAELIYEVPTWMTYDLPPRLQEKLWEGTYKGQKQKWFFLRFLGEDDEIQLDTHHPEFSDWKWVDPKDLPDLAVDFKRDTYAKLLEILMKI